MSINIKISLVGINDSGKTSLILGLYHLIQTGQIIISRAISGNVKELGKLYEIIIKLNRGAKEKKFIETYKKLKNNLNKCVFPIKAENFVINLIFRIFRENELKIVDPLNMSKEIPDEAKSILTEIGSANVLGLVVDPEPYYRRSIRTLLQSRILTFVQVALKRYIKIPRFPTIAIIIPKTDIYTEVKENPEDWLDKKDSLIIRHAKLYQNVVNIFPMQLYGENTEKYELIYYPRGKWIPHGITEFINFLITEARRGIHG